MNRQFARPARLAPLLAGAALLVFGLVPVHGEEVADIWRPAPANCPTPPVVPHGQPGFVPVPAAPGAAAPSAVAPTPAEAQAPVDVGLGDARAGAGLGESFSLAAGAYLDNPVPMTQFRMRFTAAYDDNRPDRAEFFYAKCGCFGPALGGVGPPLPETKIDYQDITGYFEYAAGERLSAFVEVPWRFLNPEQNANVNGYADMNAGFKYAMVACPDQYFTFQFRTYIPTGDASRGLGTDHVSLEPGLLWCRRLGDRLSVQGQLEDWIPVGGQDFEGNVLNGGLGATYDLYRGCNWKVAGVAEFVGWVVLSGKELATAGGPATTATLDASGNTIVNGKFGLRFWFGQNSTFYAGYGHALTGTVWYKDIFRVEYAIHF
jgi:hypothetical protein